MASHSTESPITPAATVPVSPPVGSTSSIVRIVPSQLRDEARLYHTPSRLMKGDCGGQPRSDYFSQVEEGEMIAPETQTQSLGSDPGGDRTYDGQSESLSRRRVLNQENWDQESGCGSEHCNHGTYSNQPAVPPNYTYGSFPGLGEPGGYYSNSGDAAVNGVAEVLEDRRKMSTTMWLAKKHGIYNTRLMCVRNSMFQFIVYASSHYVVYIVRLLS